MRRFRLRLACLVTAVAIAAAGVAVPHASADDPQAADVAQPLVLDRELISALDRVGAKGRFVSMSTGHDLVDLVAMQPQPDLDAARSDVVGLLSTIEAAHNERSESARELRAMSNAVDQLGRLLDEAVSASASSTGVATDLQRTMKRLQQLRVAPRDPRLDGAERSFESTRHASLAWLRSIAASGERPTADPASQPPIDDLDALRQDLELLKTSVATPSQAEADAWAALEPAMQALHDERRLRATVIDGLPWVTLDAYVAASDHGVEGCSVDWTLLAGIGRIESLHGTLDGAAVDGEGAARPRIFGPLLDGGATEREAQAAAAAEAARIAAEVAEAEAEERRLFEEEQDRLAVLFGDLYRAPSTDDGDGASGEDEEGVEEAGADEEAGSEEDDSDEDESKEEDAEEEGNGFAVIEDTDGGLLDGDAAWDRAVGPMQFLPATWELFGADGNDDGTLDPHNLYDATAAAARYLCHLEARSGAGPDVFVLGYNDSSSYVEAVLDAAASLSRFGFSPTGQVRPGA